MNFKKLGIIGVFAFLWLPTGTPEDIISFALMAQLGIWYWVIGAIALFLIWDKLEI